METERIERLAIDMAGGQLNDDVAALFSEYLDEHPDAKKTAAQITEMYNLCGNIITQRSSAITPSANGLVHKRPVLWRIIRKNVMFRAAVLLLAVMLGISAGWLLKPAPKPKADIAVAKREYTQRKPYLLSDIRAYNITGEFWQKKIMALSGCGDGQPSSHKFVTQEKSTLQKYTEYLKEKKHEF